MRIEAAPAVLKCIVTDEDGTNERVVIQITSYLHASLENAMSFYSSEVIAWPASWDASKGVWYWEGEEE